MKHLTAFFTALPAYLLLVLLLHAQSKHSIEIRAGDRQQGSVSGDALVFSHEDHIAELAVLPLLVEALQQFSGMIHAAENLQTQHNITLTTTPYSKRLCARSQEPPQKPC